MNKEDIKKGYWELQYQSETLLDSVSPVLYVIIDNGYGEYSFKPEELKNLKLVFVKPEESDGE